MERELVRHGADAQGAEAGTVTFDIEYWRQQSMQQTSMLPAYYMQEGSNDYGPHQNFHNGTPWLPWSPFTLGTSDLTAMLQGPRQLAHWYLQLHPTSNLVYPLMRPAHSTNCHTRWDTVTSTVQYFQHFLTCFFLSLQ